MPGLMHGISGPRVVEIARCLAQPTPHARWGRRTGYAQSTPADPFEQRGACANSLACSPRPRDAGRSSRRQSGCATNSTAGTCRRNPASCAAASQRSSPHPFRPAARARTQSLGRIHGPGVPASSSRNTPLRRRSFVVGGCQMLFSIPCRSRSNCGDDHTQRGKADGGRIDLAAIGSFAYFAGGLPHPAQRA